MASTNGQIFYFKLITMWMFLPLMFSFVKAKVCPSLLCDCQDNGVLFCANRRMDRIPPFMKDPYTHYEKLDLSDNVIFTVPHYAFQNINVKKIDLSGNSLVGISPRAFRGVENDLETLDLHNTGLFVIHWAVFSKLAKLKTLNLSTNGLFTLQKELLQNLHSLNDLDLSWNKLRRLGRSALTGLSSLEALSLQGNAIGSIDTDTFTNLRHLKKLNLRSNRLVTVDPMAFSRLERLLELDLSDNLLSNVPTEAFKTMLGLQMLHLDQNNITKIGSGAFKGAYKLATLSLSFNSIDNISSDGFLGLPLVSLDLSSNNLNFLGSDNDCNIQNINYVKELKLNGNPLTCNCTLSWVRSIINRNGKVFGECATPSQYSKMSLVRVDFSECHAQGYCMETTTTTPPSQPNKKDDF